MKLLFPLTVLLLAILFAPGSIPLIGMFMFGNLLRESGVVERLSSTAQNELINLVTILLGLTVGGTMVADAFLDVDTLKIFGLGLVAFSLATAGGVIFGKVMYLASGRKVNPLLGAAGVSAVPMSARVVHRVALEANPNNYLVMHAMGPNVAGVLGVSNSRRGHPEHGGLARHSANPNPAPPRRCRAIRSPRCSVDRGRPGRRRTTGAAARSHEAPASPRSSTADR